jgi:hypothetical protein
MPKSWHVFLSAEKVGVQSEDDRVGISSAEALKGKQLGISARLGFEGLLFPMTTTEAEL